MTWLDTLFILLHVLRAMLRKNPCICWLLGAASGLALKSIVNCAPKLGGNQNSRNRNPKTYDELCRWKMCWFFDFSSRNSYTPPPSFCPVSLCKGFWSDGLSAVPHRGGWGRLMGSSSYDFIYPCLWTPIPCEGCQNPLGHFTLSFKTCGCLWERT